MDISARRHANVSTVPHVTQCLETVTAVQGGKVSSVNRVVIVVGMAQDATEAVIAYISPLVIMSLDSAPAVQDGKGPGATNHATLDSMDWVANLFVSVTKITPFHVTLLMDTATVFLDGLGKSALYFVPKASMVQVVQKSVSAERLQQRTVIT